MGMVVGMVVMTVTVRCDQRALPNGTDGWAAGGADRAPLHRQRLLQMTSGQQFFVAEDVMRRAIGHYYPRVQNDGALTQLDDHIKIVAGDNAGMMKVVQ
jgi:hypothetical protein